MIDAEASPQATIDAYLHASILLDRIVPGAAVDEIDGLRHIRYGRPKVGVQHEIIAVGVERDRVLSVISARHDITPAYLATITPLDVGGQSVYERSGFTRVVRNTLMALRLPDVVPFADPSVKRLADPEALRNLALVRGDNVLDVDHFTDDIHCYVLDLDGEPVSSALLIPSLHDTAVIEHVQTLPAYRRRGYGRWLLRALHAEAARMGMRQVVLGSNQAGRPLYDALGYTAICHIDVYLVGT
jgi:GNAT superfamily N-acetyltransferase